MLKLTFIISLLSFPALSFAFPVTWTCDGGDYHLTLSGEKGDTFLNYDICEFTNCQVSLPKTATLSGQLSNEYMYNAIDGTAFRQLDLYYQGDILSEADLVENGIVIQNFMFCTQE